MAGSLAAFIAVVLVVTVHLATQLRPGWGSVGSAMPAASRPPEDQLPHRFELLPTHTAALSRAWPQVDLLTKRVSECGVVRGFGGKADAILWRAMRDVGGTGAASEEIRQVLDPLLRVLFLQQLQILVVRAVDRYDAEMASRPNPFKAGRAAEALFDRSAAELQGTLTAHHSAWSAGVEAARTDLQAQIDERYSRDVQLADEQARQGQGKRVTVEVIQKLQEQVAAVESRAATRGAFPWKVTWQYMVEKSPLGFRGQYDKGRSVVELLLTPTPDPKQQKSLLNRIGPLNLAMAFDMLT